MKDHIQVVVMLILLKLRWVYFHICPWYRKFSIAGTELHFQNMRTNTIHSRVVVEFVADSPWKRFDGVY